MQAFGKEQAVTSLRILPIVDQVSDIVNNFIVTLIPYFCFNYTTGKACKLKFRRKLKLLGTLNDALRHYSIPLFGFSDGTTQTSDVIVADASSSTSEECIDICQNIIHLFQKLAHSEQVCLLQTLFDNCCAGRFPCAKDYIQHSISGMQHLHSNHKRNVLAGAAQAFGVLRLDSSDSLFPTSRMPFGMLGYTILFFNARSKNEVRGCLYVVCQSTCSL